MLLDGQLTFGHARALAGLAGRDDEQRTLAERIIQEGLSVRQAERLVALRQGRTAEKEGQATRRAKPPYVEDVERRLSQAVGTRVVIQPGRRKNAGRIVIEYYSLDDFERIASALGLEDDA